MLNLKFIIEIIISLKYTTKTVSFSEIKECLSIILEPDKRIGKRKKTILQG